jgi:hypothetical protein
VSEPAPAPALVAEPELALDARPTAVLGRVAVQPAPAPAVLEVAVSTPSVAMAARVAALLLALVVGLQALTVRRLGVVAA